MKIKENGVFVQIGTNDGNDDFIKIVNENKPSKIILVEPNFSLNEKIKQNYKEIKNYIIENYAITSDNMGMVELVVPKNDPKTGKSVNGVSYGDKGFTLIPMDDWGNDFEKIESKSISFNELCKKHNLTHIDYLHIDTEGYDAEIIKSIDFDSIDINIIKYEYWPFDEECFKRHGENSNLYGNNAMNFLNNFLKEKGYNLTEEIDWEYCKNIIATKN
jgi:FkbM family methyltransferase